MENVGERQPFLVIFSFTNLEVSIPKFPLRISKYSLKNYTQVLIAFLIFSTSTFGFLSTKLNRGKNCAQLKNIATLCTRSTPFLKSIRFLIVNLVMLAEQYRLSPNHKVSYSHSND